MPKQYPALTVERLWSENLDLLRSLTRQNPIGEDLIQEIFLELHQKPDCLVGIRNPRGWLTVIFRRRAIDALRGEQRRKLVHEAALANELVYSGPNKSGAEAMQDAVFEYLRRCPAQQREVVVGRAIHGYCFRELAAIHGISINTAASLYRRFLHKFVRRKRHLQESASGGNT